jgi:DNA polymerase elongation subunit (family B)
MKILTLDIETSPHLSWHFRRFKENIPKRNTEIESRMLCWAAKWYGQKTVHFAANFPKELHEFNEAGHVKMLTRLWKLLDEADVVVGFNSKKFDVRRIQFEFVKYGLEQPSPFDQVDLYLEHKKNFATSSNRLEDVLEELGLERKLDNEGMPLWINTMHGVAEARKNMKLYNKQDVVATEDLYTHIRGWIASHPNWGLFVNDDEPICPNCGSEHMNRHKIRRTRVRRYVQYQCQDCGHYARGRKSEGSGDGVLA